MRRLELLRLFRLEVVLLDRLKRVSEVVLRDVAAKDDAGDAREAVVQARPDPRVDDLRAKVVRRFEVAHGIEVSGRPRGIEAVDVEVDVVGAEEGAEHLGHRRRDHAVRRRVFGWFGVVRSGRQPGCSTVAALPSS